MYRETPARFGVYMSKFQKGSIVKVRGRANPKWKGLTGEVISIKFFKNTSYMLKILEAPGWEKKVYTYIHTGVDVITFHHPHMSPYAIPTVWKESKLTWTDNQILVDA